MTSELNKQLPGKHLDYTKVLNLCLSYSFVSLVVEVELTEFNNHLLLQAVHLPVISLSSQGLVGVMRASLMKRPFDK